MSFKIENNDKFSGGFIEKPLYITNNQELRLYETSTNGDNHTAIKSASNISSNVTYVLPSAVGGVNEVLTSADKNSAFEH